MGKTPGIDLGPPHAQGHRTKQTAVSPGSFRRLTEIMSLSAKTWDGAHQVRRQIRRTHRKPSVLS